MIMKFKILRENHYNGSNEHIKTIYRVKRQKSFFGFTYWRYEHDRHSSMAGNIYVKWQSETLEEIEEMLQKRIDDILETKRTTTVSVETDFIKEVTV